MKLNNSTSVLTIFIVLFAAAQGLADTGKTYGPWRYFAPYYFSPSRSCLGIPLTPDDFKAKYELPNPRVPGKPVPAPPETKVRPKVMAPRPMPSQPVVNRPGMSVKPTCAPMVQRRPPYAPMPSACMGVQRGCFPKPAVVSRPPCYPKPPLSPMCVQKRCAPQPQTVCKPPACPPPPLPNSCAPQACAPSAPAPPPYVQNLYKPISFGKAQPGPVCAPPPPACGPEKKSVFY
jgi:hypothetical protein